jgi:hypothetical protein
MTHSTPRFRIRESPGVQIRQAAAFTLNLRPRIVLGRCQELARSFEFSPWSIPVPSAESISSISSSAATVLSSTVSSSSLAVLRLSRDVKADERTARRRFSLCSRRATEPSNSATCAFGGAICLDSTPRHKTARGNPVDSGRQAHIRGSVRTCHKGTHSSASATATSIARIRFAPNRWLIAVRNRTVASPTVTRT